MLLKRTAPLRLLSELLLRVSVFLLIFTFLKGTYYWLAIIPFLFLWLPTRKRLLKEYDKKYKAKERFITTLEDLPDEKRKLIESQVEPLIKFDLRVLLNFILAAFCLYLLPTSNPYVRKIDILLEDPEVDKREDLLAIKEALLSDGLGSEKLEEVLKNIEKEEEEDKKEEENKPSKEDEQQESESGEKEDKQQEADNGEEESKQEGNSGEKGQEGKDKKDEGNSGDKDQEGKDKGDKSGNDKGSKQERKEEGEQEGQDNQGKQQGNNQGEKNEEGKEGENLIEEIKKEHQEKKGNSGQQENKSKSDQNQGEPDQNKDGEDGKEDQKKEEGSPGNKKGEKEGDKGEEKKDENAENKESGGNSGEAPKEGENEEEGSQGDLKFEEVSIPGKEEKIDEEQTTNESRISENSEEAKYKRELEEILRLKSDPALERRKQYIPKEYESLIR